MRLIDADALLPMMKYATTDSEIGVFPIKISFNTIAKVIDDTPTIDAVPVIRCKDCVEFRRWNDECGECYDGLADGGMVRADGYCYAAERKNDGIQK